MAKTYRLGCANRLINLIYRAQTRLGLGAPYRHILTVHGRKTGRPYSTPVDVIELEGSRYPSPATASPAGCATPGRPAR